MSTLIEAIKRNDWYNVQNHLIETRLKDEEGSTALHYACCESAPFSIIKLLINADPRLVFETDLSGSTPLHYACCNPSIEDDEPCDFDDSERVIELLLKINPRAAFSKDCFNFTPLHLACKHKLSP